MLAKRKSCTGIELLHSYESTSATRRGSTTITVLLVAGNEVCVVLKDSFSHKAGVSRVALAAIGSHKSPRVTLVYSHPEALMANDKTCKPRTSKKRC